MTTYSRRRAKRSLAAILAAMLMASVLAVVAGSPAQAANTSGEYLFDHDEDSSTAMEREFAGRDRYDTALKLATRFAKDRGGIGSVPNAFVASGESLVDAVSVAGLAGFMDAPVLLTRSGSLHGGVTDFIEDYGVTNIYVLGGTAAVSDDVVDALKAVAGVGSVERIAGDTRYDTSAAIASHLAGESWCGTNENSAIITNGADDSLFNAVAIGPVANRLELPVLLTAGDDLVDAVTSYIDAEGVEHAVIVGGTSSVSEDVEQALSDSGVDTVERIDGDTAAEVSVAIAEVIGDECADDLSPVAFDAVALVNSGNVIDGIPAAPVLADDADQLANGLVPILAVGDTLPASVRDYLAGTPEERANGDKIHMRVLAIGGIAAVSDSVMAAAVDAASSADALTVNIGTAAADDSEAATNENRFAKDGKTPILVAGDSRVTLYFSDDVTQEESANLRNKLEDILFVNGIPADIQSDGTTDAECKPDSVTVMLSNSLKSGDTVSIQESGTAVGASKDLRPVQPASATVPAAPVDRQRPSIRIVAIIGHDKVYGLVSDDTELEAAANTLLADVIADADDEPLIETVNGDANITAVAAAIAPDNKSAVLTFTLSNDPNTPSETEAQVDRGDRFRVNRGAVVDEAGNESQVTSATAVSAVGKLQVSSVLMSELNHTAQAMAPIPSSYAGQDPPADGAPREAAPYMQLVAKKGGAADGALGNGWQIRADRSSSWDPNKAVDIDVFVSTKDRRIVVRYVNGSPKFADLKAALEGNSTVTSLFEVRIDNAYQSTVNTCRAANSDLDVDALQVNAPTAGGDDPENSADRDDVKSLSGGITKARIEVNFNGWIQSQDVGQPARLLAAVLTDTRGRAAKVGAISTDETGEPARTDALQTKLLALQGMIGDDGTQETLTLADKQASTGPKRTIGFDIETRIAAALPAPRDIVDIPDGFRKALNGNPWDSAPDTDGLQRSDDSHTRDEADATNPGRAHAPSSVADGYGDTAADDNDWNYGSKVRIVRSGNVTAPN